MRATPLPTSPTRAGRTIVRRVLAGAAVLGVLVIVATWIATAALASNALLVQRVEPQASGLASLFGTSGPGTLIGSPQRVLPLDERAFLPGATPDGARFVNEAYLRDNGLYPLQVKTLEFVRDVTTAVGGAVIAALLLAWWWLGRATGTGR